MKDDGNRLSFSISENDFYITENLSGAVTLYRDGNIIFSTLNYEVSKQHIQSLQEAIMSFSLSKQPFWKKLTGPASEEGKLIINEVEHFKWVISYSGSIAILEDNTLKYENGFDKTKVLRLINYVYATLLCQSEPLNPKRDIVRRIVDIGLLVWVNGEDNVVVYENNVSGNVMTNCFVNGRYFQVVLVSTSLENKETTLFTTSLDELVSFPLDNSILTFYPPDDDSFNF